MLAKKNRLNKGSDFDRAKEKGKVYQSQSFGASVFDRDDQDESRFGYVVSSKISKMAVHRNRVKRALREAVRQNIKYTPRGYDIVFLAKKNIMEKSTEEIMNEVEDFLGSPELKR